MEGSGPDGIGTGVNEPSSGVNQGVGGAGAGERLLSHPLSQTTEPAQGPNSAGKKEKRRPGAEWSVEGVPANPENALGHCWGLLLPAPSPSLTSAGGPRNPSDSHVLQKAK